MPEEEENQEEQPQKKGPPKVILFIVGGMILLTAVAFFGVRFMTGSSKTEEEAKQKEGGEGVAEIYNTLFSFDQAIVVNLAETNGQRYLKVNMQLEMSDEILAEELTARAPQILDLIISILSSKTIEDATTVIGRNRLKREIVDRINAEIVSGKVTNVFFTEFVIQ